MEVEQLAARFQHLEAMGTALRNQQCIGSPGRQLHGVPLAAGRGIGPQIHRHIPDAAAQAADHLGLAVGWRLQMEPSDRAHCFGAANVYLYDVPISPGLGEGKLLSAKGIQKRAAVVAKGLAH